MDGGVSDEGTETRNRSFMSMWWPGIASMGQYRSRGMIV